jgi:hypothetical protein
VQRTLASTNGNYPPLEEISIFANDCTYTPSALPDSRRCWNVHFLTASQGYTSTFFELPDGTFVNDGPPSDQRDAR